MVICMGVKVVGLVLLLIEKNVFCVICLFYKYKDSCEYFEMCIYKWFIDIFELILKIVDLLMCFDLLVGVDIEIKFLWGWVLWLMNVLLRVCWVLSLVWFSCGMSIIGLFLWLLFKLDCVLLFRCVCLRLMVILLFSLVMGLLRWRMLLSWRLVILRRLVWFFDVILLSCVLLMFLNIFWVRRLLLMCFLGLILWCYWY